MPGRLHRPSVADMIFRVDAQAFHPEFFQTLAYRRVARSDDLIQVRIIPSGHALHWSAGSLQFTECLLAPELELPTDERRLQYRCVGSWRGQYETIGVRYSINGQLERISPDIYSHVHQELAEDGLRRGLLFHFEPTSQLGFPPLSYLTVEAFPGGLSISAFHTFPEEWAIIRTQTLIEPSLG